MSKPKVSVVITARNEYPVILGTIYSFWEELTYWGYPFEIIVVDNMSTDNTSDILKDRFRRWVKAGLLKVVQYNERPANVLVRNVGARAASGEVVVLADAHLSIDTGTIDGMIRGWQEEGGLWHTCTHIWGDTSDIKCYGYQLKLEEKFWGNLSRQIPPDIPKDEAGIPRIPYQVPMASHCVVLAGREEYLDFGGYNEQLKCYGGGEPYLDLKWWLFGSKVWIYPMGLARHAFGTEAIWRKVGHDKKFDTLVWTRDRKFERELKEGKEYLHYSRGYAWTNEQLHHNFMMAAYTIGGYAWLQKIYNRYYEIRKGNERYVKDLNDLRREVLRDGAADRKFIEDRQKTTLDDLLKQTPWNNSSASRSIVGSSCQPVAEATEISQKAG